jgi:hypothetical protein
MTAGVTTMLLIRLAAVDAWNSATLVVRLDGQVLAKDIGVSCLAQASVSSLTPGCRVNLARI